MHMIQQALSNNQNINLEPAYVSLISFPISLLSNQNGH